MLSDYGIDPGSYHGGNLIGNHCKKLLDNSEDIFDAVGRLLEEFSNNRSKSVDLIQDVLARTEATSKTLQVFEQIC